MSTRAAATRGVVATLCLAVAIAVPAAAAPTRHEAAGQVRIASSAPTGRAHVARTASRHVADTSAATATGAPGRRLPARTVRIRHYADAPGSQRAIDACRLVLWTVRPLWLAGHNYCGYQWLAHIRIGTVVRVTSGRAAGRYVVTGHRRLARQSGPLPRLRADLVLQTCVGHGTALTLARRVR